MIPRNGDPVPRSGVLAKLIPVVLLEPGLRAQLDPAKLNMIPRNQLPHADASYPN